jgi:hypothetical protein
MENGKSAWDMNRIVYGNVGSRSIALHPCLYSLVKEGGGKVYPGFFLTSRGQIRGERTFRDDDLN